MPLLDCSFMCEDPLLADTFDVRRRVQAVGPDGRVSAVPDEVFTGLIGVVTQQDPSDLIRTEDGQSLPRRIFIASRFAFIAAGPNMQPDEVLWNGVLYTVSSSLPYSRYGAGFYEAILEFRGPVPPIQ